MKRTIFTMLKLAAGGVFGYAIYFAYLLGTVLLRAARIHYFDDEMLLYGAIAPIGALGAYATGDWHGYATWIHCRNFFAYGLIICGGIFASLYKRRR
jgi:hypothetical protein